MTAVVLSTGPPPQARPAGVADVCAVVPTIIANHRASMSQLYTLLRHVTVLTQDPGTSHLDFHSLAGVLWSVCERFGAKSAAAAKETPHTTIVEVSSAAAVIAALYSAKSHAALEPTAPDLECAVKLSKAASAFASVRKAPPSSPAALPQRPQIALARASWMLLGAVVPVDRAAVLRQIKEHCWATAQLMPVGSAVELIRATELAVCDLVKDASILNRFTLAAEILCAFPGDATFDARSFVTRHAPAASGRRPPPPHVASAPAALDGLGLLLSVQSATVAAVRKAAGPSGCPSLDVALREAIDATRRKSGTFGVGHLGIVVSIGDKAFLAALLAKRLETPTAEVDAPDATTRVRLPLSHGPAADAPSTSQDPALPRDIVDSPSSNATVLVAVALASAATAVSGPAAVSSKAPQSAALAAALKPVLDSASHNGAADLVTLYFDHILRMRGTESAVRDAGGSAGVEQPANPVLRRHMRTVVVELVTRDAKAQAEWVRRAVSAAGWSVQRAQDALRTGSRQMRAVASHGYEVQRSLRDTAQTIAEVSREARRGSAEDRIVPISADGALTVLKALASMQAVCLMHRSAMPKSSETKKIAAEDWRLLRVAGFFLVDLIATESVAEAEINTLPPPTSDAATSAPKDGPSKPPKTPMARLLRHIRTLTRTPRMDTDFFVSEPLFFLSTVLNNNAAVRCVSERDMLRHWVPAAIRCILATGSPALRRSGHVLLAVPLVESHPSALGIFPTYVNIFVSSPHSRATALAAAATHGEDQSASAGVVSYGPVPDDSLKLFSRYFRHVASAVEAMDGPHPAPSASSSAPSTAAILVDGPQLVKWAVRQLAAVAGYFLALQAPSREDVQRRRIYFCTLIDCVQLSNPVALDTACAAIEALLLSMPNPAEAAVFLDYASGAVQASQAVATKKSMAEWLLELKEKLAARHPPSAMRSKL